MLPQIKGRLTRKRFLSTAFSPQTVSHSNLLCHVSHGIFVLNSLAGTKKMEYKTRQWHEKCFCCCVCKTPIGTKSFIPREQEIYCAGCYEEKFATRCIKCNKVTIAKLEGIFARGELCTECSISDYYEWRSHLQERAMAS